MCIDNWHDGCSACFINDLCHHNSAHCLFILIDKYCSLPLSIQDGSTPLIVASLKGHVDIVHVLLEAHVHVNQQTKVLHMFKDHFACCSFLSSQLFIYLSPAFTTCLHFVTVLIHYLHLKTITCYSTEWQNSTLHGLPEWPCASCSFAASKTCWCQHFLWGTFYHSEAVHSDYTPQPTLYRWVSKRKVGHEMLHVEYCCTWSKSEQRTHTCTIVSM